jgi:F-box interacting protein
MASSCSSHLPSSIMTLPTQKHFSSVDAVFGNDDLVTEILLRVPAKAVLKLKLVSKKWLSIISPTSFAILHTRRNPHTVSALLLNFSSFFEEPSKHKYVSLDGKSLVYLSYDFLDFDPNNLGCFSTYVSQSCNGLLLCPKWRWCSTERSKPTDYIFNPTTRQFALLPLPPNDGKYFTQIQLVFDPLESPRYRVVCIQFFNSELKIYVYSSETKDWKLSVKLENFDLLSVNFTDGVSWNGAVHWMSPMGNGLSFLLDMECLQTIPRPPLPENWQDKNFRYFGESGGQLHFIGILAGNQNPDDLNLGIVSPDMSHDQSTDQSIVVYSMERGCSKWFAKYCLHMNAIVMAYPEITEDKDPTTSPFSAEKWFDLLSFIEGNDEEGALLVMRISGEIISYSFKNNILKKILSFPLKHATCYAFNYTETLSCV